ncbi:Hypothetical_protein [Hexamita inflata]|uniref:Hypothetical_protein n=1 Tax=Hexamita inflata TaxID=28002 RepID=A0AA86URC0_9EUKA|nr:Hypothetical protein HINF_LOCUS49186 [Hexamita inflata]
MLFQLACGSIRVITDRQIYREILRNNQVSKMEEQNLQNIVTEQLCWESKRTVKKLTQMNGLNKWIASWLKNCQKPLEKENTLEKSLTSCTLEIQSLFTLYINNQYKSTLQLYYTVLQQ